MKLKYKNITSSQGEMNKVSSAWYGGHLKKFGMTPPTYLLSPDYIIIDNNVKRALRNLRKALMHNKTVFFHLDMSVEESFRNLNDSTLQALLTDISGFENSRDSVIYLPPTAKLIRTYSKENCEAFYTYIYDDGTISSENKNNAFYSVLKNFLESKFRVDRMIWTPNELPGSLISFIWSKRIIHSNFVIDNCLSSNELKRLSGIKENNQTYFRNYP